MINRIIEVCAQWLHDAFIAFLATLFWLLITVLKTVFDIFLSIFETVVNALPDCMDCFGIGSQVSAISSQVSFGYLDYFVWFLNWIFPVSLYLEIFGCFIASFATVYPFIVLLRWIKAAD